MLGGDDCDDRDVFSEWADPLRRAASTRPGAKWRARRAFCWARSLKAAGACVSGPVEDGERRLGSMAAQLTGASLRSSRGIAILTPFQLS